MRALVGVSQGGSYDRTAWESASGCLDLLWKTVFDAEPPRELAAINRRSNQILELLLQGFKDNAWKLELAQIERRRAELEATIAASEVEPVLPAPHPHMATVYRQKVEQLTAAPAHEDEEWREAARSALRGFVTAIVIPPGDGLLEVRGDLGRMLRSSRRRARRLSAGGCCL